VRNANSHRSAAFVVCRREDDAIVGVFNLSEIVGGSFQSCYSSYYAHAAFAGNGYRAKALTSCSAMSSASCDYIESKRTSSPETPHPSPLSAVPDSGPKATRRVI
jgi:hypothetical protein